MVSVVFRRAAAAVVAIVVAAGLLSARPVSANATTTNPGIQPAEAAGAVELVEAVTGTADVVDVAPGESGVAVTVPVEADEAVHIETVGASVSFEQPHSPAGGEVVVSDHGTVSYLNDDAPFNTHLQVVASPDPSLLSQGARSLIEIESIHAPREYVYPVDAGEGVVLTVQPDGGVLGTRGEHVVLVVPAPWARDAAGAVVPTRYEVRGTDLVQIVDFTPAHTFPIIADPVWFVPVLLVSGSVARVAVQAATATAARGVAVREAAAQTGKAGVRATGAAVQAQYRAFTGANARHNLIVRTGKNPGNCQAHHTMPQASDLQARFASMGINIHDPQYMLWWVSTPGTANNHTSLSAAYNNDWRWIFSNHPPRNTEQVLWWRNEMVKKYAAFYRC